MNRSYSKIRHIQDANINLEKRMLKEQTSDPINSSESVKEINPTDAATIVMKWNDMDTIGLTKFLIDSKRGSIKIKVDELKNIYSQNTNDDAKLKELGNLIVKDDDFMNKIKEFANKNNLSY
jgi:hypothetical protein